MVASFSLPPCGDVDRPIVFAQGTTLINIMIHYVSLCIYLTHCTSLPVCWLALETAVDPADDPYPYVSSLISPCFVCGLR